MFGLSRVSQQYYQIVLANNCKNCQTISSIDSEIHIKYQSAIKIRMGVRDQLFVTKSLPKLLRASKSFETSYQIV